jgi:hypothetical protein
LSGEKKSANSLSLLYHLVADSADEAALPQLPMQAKSHNRSDLSKRLFGLCTPLGKESKDKIDLY